MELQIIATNRKAYHDYFILDKLEAGLELAGSEVKSLRESRASLKEAYIRIRYREVYVVGMHISPYSHTGFEGHEPTRERRLLLNRKEILKLQQAVDQKGFTAIPLRLYFKAGWAKLEIGVARGKKTYSKKEALKARDIKRQAEREMGKIT